MTDDDIRNARGRARALGDGHTVDLCDLALDGNATARGTVERAAAGSARPCVSVPAALRDAYLAAGADHALPPLSRLLADAMRRELSQRGVHVPDDPTPARTAAATVARWRTRQR